MNRLIGQVLDSSNSGIVGHSADSPTGIVVIWLPLGSGNPVNQLQCNAMNQFQIVDKKNKTIKCQNCKICPAGEEAHPFCDSVTYQPAPVDQSCHRCRDGYFKADSSELQCRKCKGCVKDQLLEQNCTSKADAKCAKKCIDGKYMGKDSHCHACCRCFSGSNQFELQCARVHGKNCRGTFEGSCAEDSIISTSVSNSTIKSTPSSVSSVQWKDNGTTSATENTSAVHIPLNTRSIKYTVGTENSSRPDTEQLKTTTITEHLQNNTGQSNFVTKTIRTTEKPSVSVPKERKTESPVVVDFFFKRHAKVFAIVGGIGGFILLAIISYLYFRHNFKKTWKLLKTHAQNTTAVEYFHSNDERQSSDAVYSEYISMSNPPRTLQGQEPLAPAGDYQISGCEQDSSVGLLFAEVIEENLQMYDLVKDALQNEPEVVQFILKSLIKTTSVIKTCNITTGESLINKLVTEVPGSLKLSSFLGCLINDRVKQIELHKGLCEELYNELCEELRKLLTRLG